MLFVFWLLFVLICLCLFLMMPALMGAEIFHRYQGVRAVTCPETRRQVAVRFNALHATVTGLGGTAKIRLADCSRWPERANCDQDCIPEALRAKPYCEGEIAPPRAKKIYHLPVFVAALAAWLLGVVLHSQFLLRTQWRNALGMSRSELQPIVEWLVPHLLTLAVPVLFGYGVAWLLALSTKHGVWQGIFVSIGLWAAIAITSVGVSGPGWISGSLLLMEAAYTLCAATIMGAIIGGLAGKMVEETFEEE